MERRRVSVGAGCGGPRRGGDGSEGLDEDRSKDSDEGRDDVVGKSVSIWGRRRWDFQQR